MRENTESQKLQHIQELWFELGSTKPDDPKYDTLMKQIRVSCVEYASLLEPS
jgi:hypothetical protein